MRAPEGCPAQRLSKNRFHYIRIRNMYSVFEFNKNWKSRRERNVKDLLNFGQMLSVHARVTPGRIGARDLDRALTFTQWNERACRLANALLGLGLAKGERVAVLAYNCVEWCEIFAATAKAGLVALPINFRLTGKEVQFIVNNAEAAACILQDELISVVEEIRKDIPIKANRFIHFGIHPCPAGYHDYEDFLAAG